MIISAFLKALGQIGDPRFRSVLFIGVGLTVALFLAIYVVVFQIISWITGGTMTLPLIGQIHWAGAVLSWGSIPLMLLASSFLMIPVASAFTSMFLDRVADSVEDRHYPALPPAKSMSMMESLRDALWFMGILIVANLLGLLLYGVLYFTLPPLAPVVFCVINGYLLGTEYFQLAAMRRLSRSEAKALRKKNNSTVVTAGILMALPLTIPILNLVIPILGVATFTHIFHSILKRTN